jgi:3-deoxy-D-manno-octulosonic-acid transferase
VLNCFTHFFVQNEVSKQLLAKIGITDVTVVGDTRFDRVLQIKEAAKQLPVVEAFVKDAPQVFVAGSSWPPDEEIFIKYFNEHKNWKLIIAPHVIGEDHLKQIEKLLEGRKVVRYTDAEKSLTSDLSSLTSAEVLIINCYGLLSSIYHYGHVAYVGGGFGVGIHNLLEAAVWDVPVFFGPNNQKFQEAQALKQSGGFEIHNYEEFAQQMDRFSSDAQYLKEQGKLAGQFVKGQAGATAKVLGSVTLP